MKTLKRIFAVAMVLVMVVALGVVAMAAETKYYINIEDAVKDNVYVVYRLFDATSDGTSVSYTLATGTVWPTTGTDKTNLETYFTCANDYVTAKTSSGTAVALSDGNMKAKAVEALAVLTNNINKVKSVTATADATKAAPLQIEVPGPGYYYISGSTGTESAVCLTTVITSTTITDKLPAPGPGPDPDPTPGPDGYKFVKDGDSYGDSTVAAYGETVEFHVTFTGVNKITKEVGEGDNKAYKTEEVQTYTIKDFPTGLKDMKITSIKIGGVEKVPATGFVASVAGVYTYTETQESGKDCKKLVLNWTNATGEFLYEPSTVVAVTYTAVVNDVGEATDYVAAENYATMLYNSTPFTPETPSIVTVKNYPLTVITKTDGGTQIGGSNYTVTTGSGASIANLKVVELSTGVYRLADADDTSTLELGSLLDGSGKFVIKGLKGTYTATMNSAPNGYNPASATEQTATITNSAAELNFVVTKGVLLPTTGGIGTTLFYVLGTVLVLGTAVLFVTKKRMDAEN